MLIYHFTLLWELIFIFLIVFAVTSVIVTIIFIQMIYRVQSSQERESGKLGKCATLGNDRQWKDWTSCMEVFTWADRSWWWEKLGRRRCLEPKCRSWLKRASLLKAKRRKYSSMRMRHCTVGWNLSMKCTHLIHKQKPLSHGLGSE